MSLVVVAVIIVFVKVSGPLFRITVSKCSIVLYIFVFYEEKQISLKLLLVP